MAWNWLSAKVERKMPRVRLAKMNTSEATYSSSSEPRTGTSNSSRPTSRITVTCTRPMPTKGSTLPMVSSQGDTGVVMSISMLPRSRSRTRAMAVNSTMVMVRITPTSPGTVFSGARRSGLYRLTTDTLLGFSQPGSG
ncbi:hypothetical protein D9M70_259010 [compost metagenome]